MVQILPVKLYFFTWNSPLLQDTQVTFIARKIKGLCMFHMNNIFYTCKWIEMFYKRCSDDSCNILQCDLLHIWHNWNFLPIVVALFMKSTRHINENSETLPRIFNIMLHSTCLIKFKEIICATEIASCYF